MGKRGREKEEGRGGRGVIYARVCGEEGKNFIFEKPFPFAGVERGEREESYFNRTFKRPFFASSSPPPPLTSRPKESEGRKHHCLHSAKRRRGGGEFPWLFGCLLNVCLFYPPGRVLLCAGDTKCAK